MAETLNSREEAQMLAAVKKAVDLVDGGMSPDDAIEKVAREEGYGAGRIRLISHAYNNGRQLSQWHNRDANVLDKLANFPLADAEAVISRIYSGPTPAEKAAADRVDPDYALPPTWLKQRGMEKAAHAPLPSLPALEPYAKDPVEAMYKTLGNVRREKLAAEEASRLAANAEDRVRGSVAQLVTYFKQASYSRLPFEVVEHAARAYIGQDAAPLLDMAYKQARLREKRAGDSIPVLRDGVDVLGEPFTFIADAIKSAQDCHRLREAAKAQAEKHATVKEAAFRPFAKAGHSEAAAVSGRDPFAAAIEKQGFGFGTEVAAIALGDIAGQAIHHRIDPLMQQHAPGENPEDEIIDDAGQQQEIAGIRNRATLDAMLADPKNPLSKHPVPDVVAAYNALAKTNPDALADQAKLQPLLMGHFNKKAIKKAVDVCITKEGIFDLASAGAGVQMGRMMGNPVKDNTGLIEDKWMELEDPHHANELRKIKAHALITQLMTDPEDPISGHDPDMVLSAFNELSSASPRVADNIHTLRPALRRKLQGNQEPFEAKELLDIEKGLAATKLPTPNTSALGNAPDKLLG